MMTQKALEISQRSFSLVAGSSENVGLFVHGLVFMFVCFALFVTRGILVLASHRV